jgi:hypothetical protein
MLTKSPPIAILVNAAPESASMADLPYLAPVAGARHFHLGLTEVSDPQLRSHRATASRDAQSPHRTLTGWRPVRIDESASFVDSGAL